MARIGAGVTVVNAATRQLKGSGHRDDPGGISDDVFVSVNIATVKTVDALEAALAEIVQKFRGSGYLNQH